MHLEINVNKIALVQRIDSADKAEYAKLDSKSALKNKSDQKI